MGANWGREIREIIQDWKEATAGVAELEAEERDKAIEEYRKAWNRLPWPVKVTTTYAGCAVLASAALGATAKGKPSVAAKISKRAADLGCTVGVTWIDLSIDDSDPDGDPDGDQDGDDDTDDGPPTLGDVRDAEAKWRRGKGEMTKDELTRIQNEYDCAQGWADACAALGR